MTGFEQEVMCQLEADFLADGVPAHLLPSAVDIAKGIYRQPDRAPMAFWELKAEVKSQILFRMSQDELLTYTLKKMSDREVLEAIYKKLHA